MAESLINTRRRINTIKSTEKITKAMKLVASVKFQRWKHCFDDNKAYREGFKSLFETTLNNMDEKTLKENPLVKTYPDAKKNLYIVVTSTLGLCGAYNFTLFKELDPILKENDELLFIGQKGEIHYKGKGYKTNEDYLSLLDQDYRFGKVKGLRHYLIRLYRTGEYQSINLVYTHYKNSLTFLPLIEKVLPLDVSSYEKKEENWDYPPLFDPDASQALDNILPHYLDSELYTKIMEAELSELASRRNAMETATDSADKIVQQLMITYNKTRQNAITQEITEVVAGASAGKEEDE